MADSDKNTSDLWKYFATVKQNYSSNSWSFLKIPEFDINSPQEYLELFDSLNDERKQEFAALFGQEPEEFRASVEREWEQKLKEFFKDVKHPHTTQYEGYFYRIIDPIV
jgi:hypothetical protein